MQHEKEAVKTLFASESETLKDLAKFAKLILLKFRKMSQGQAKQGPELKKIRLLRSSREIEIKLPTRFNL